MTSPTTQRSQGRRSSATPPVELSTITSPDPGAGRTSKTRSLATALRPGASASSSGFRPCIQT